MKQAFQIINKLMEHNFEAYIVGGAVRDFLLGMEPNDIDITTSATPEAVMRLFKAIPTGLKFGSVTVMMGQKSYEVTTFREDFDYQDSRRPSKIRYAKTAKEDVLRRDFTINALLMDTKYNIIDYTNGQADLKSKLIRAVGVPHARFTEDALRILRAIHFVSKLGFDLEADTKQAMQDLAHTLINLAGERIYAELVKVQKGQYFQKAITVLKSLKITDSLSFLSKGTKFYIKNCNMLEQRDYLTFIGALDLSACEQLRFSRQQMHMCTTLSNLINKNFEITPYIIYDLGYDMIRMYNNYLNAVKSTYSLTTKKLDKLTNSLKLKNRNDLKITNHEIISLANIAPGPWVKNVERNILIEVLNNNFENNHDKLLILAKELIKNEIPSK